MPASARRPIRGLRWWIGFLLMMSTIINYVDRQTLSVLAPYLKSDYGWNNGDFAKIVISFRLAYAIGQSVCGRLMDRLEELTRQLARQLGRPVGEVAGRGATTAPRRSSRRAG